MILLIVKICLNVWLESTAKQMMQLFLSLNIGGEKVQFQIRAKQCFHFVEIFCFINDNPMLSILKQWKYPVSNRIIFYSLNIVNFICGEEFVHIMKFIMIMKETVLSMIFYYISVVNCIFPEIVECH